MGKKHVVSQQSGFRVTEGSHWIQIGFVSKKVCTINAKTNQICVKFDVGKVIFLLHLIFMFSLLQKM